MNIVGIDIGGTTIKADLYQSDGRSLNQFREVTTEIDFEKKTNQILEQVCQLIAFYKEKFELDGVAISSAGVVDSQAGKISYAGYTLTEAGINNTSRKEYGCYDKPHISLCIATQSLHHRNRARCHSSNNAKECHNARRPGAQNKANNRSRKDSQQMPTFRLNRLCMRQKPNNQAYQNG